MRIDQQVQQNPVADETAALTAMTRPILVAIAQSVARERLDSIGLTYSTIPLLNLKGLWEVGDGDLGNAFEFVVHHAVINGDPVVAERIVDALKLCRINAEDPGSIFFAVEKRKAKQLIDTRLDLITPDSVSMSGRAGRPMKLMPYMNQLAAAFYRETAALNLPQSAKGLWKADLFLGSLNEDRWVGTSVKSNPRDITVRSMAGLRIAILPSSFSPTDAVRIDEQRQIVMCPLPYDGSFVASFYQAWHLMQTLVAYNFGVVPDHLLTTAPERHIAELYKQHREHTIEQVLEATSYLAQPHLLDETTQTAISLAFQSDVTSETSGIVAPVPTLG